MRSRGSEHRGAILCCKAIENLLVGHAGVDVRSQFCKLHWRIRAAHMVALTENLAASTAAHHLVIKLVVARARVACSQREANRDSECSGLQGSFAKSETQRSWHLSRHP